MSGISNQKLTEVCRLLFEDLSPDDIYQIVLEPHVVTVSFYLRNADGSKYVGDDGTPAKATRHYEVSG